MNSVGHFEIPAEDKEESMEFYESVFGWQVKDVPMKMEGETGEYTTATTIKTDPESGMPSKPGGINGAIVERTSHVKTPVLTITVDSIDDSLKKVEEAGGKTTGGKEEVENMGWYAYFTDPAGNELGLWQNMKQA